MFEAFLFFKLQDQLFAVEQTEILAIGRMKDYVLHPIPTGDSGCLGALHHRGRIVPVLDTKRWLLPTKAPMSLEPQSETNSELSPNRCEEPFYSNSAINTSGQLIFYNARVGPIALYVDSVSHDADLLSMAGQWQFVELSALI